MTARKIEERVKNLLVQYGVSLMVRDGRFRLVRERDNQFVCLGEGATLRELLFSYDARVTTLHGR